MAEEPGYVYSYMATLSLSLALLNVLPLPRLDGAHMVEAVLDQLYPGTRSATSATITSTTGAMVSAGGDGEDAIERGLVPLSLQDEVVQVKRHRIERFVSVGSLGVVVLAIGGGLLASILDG
jgi:membrane-associated protease RseP (regulator of RpoE activity)